MTKRSRQKQTVLASTDQPVSFAELFFDLVFVYAITQVVHIMHGSLDWLHLMKAVLVFWLIWWAWTQFTWALNAANTRHHAVQVAILLATAIAFFMAVIVPSSFDNGSAWFALAYVGGRGIGLLIYLWVTWQNEDMRSAVKTFSALSLAGMFAVLAGGFLGGDYQYWLWGFAIGLDVMAALIGGRNASWNIHAGHFAERHGLFVIIALGETLIIAASAVTEEFWNNSLIFVSLLGVGITCCLWWIYFFRTKSMLEHVVSSLKGADRSKMARDVFSLLHFPLLCGLIIYAFAIEEAMLYPEGPMSTASRLALAIGIFIFSTGIILVVWRATGKFLLVRLLSTIIICSILLLVSNHDTIWVMTIALVGLILLCAIDEIKNEPAEVEVLE